MTSNSIMILVLLAITLWVHQATAGFAEVASRIVCTDEDSLVPVLMSDCRPFFTLPLDSCNTLMRRCKCQHDIMMKWTAQGCPKQNGDGGCQCFDYCGWKCRDKCLSDPENRCFWTPGSGCKNKYSGVSGPLTVCYNSTSRPTRSPTLAPSFALNPNPRAPIDLKTAMDFVILTKAGISNVFQSRIVGDMGVSPISASAITGFVLSPNPVMLSDQFTTSPEVAGRIYASDYATPTPSKLTVAIQDMGDAYTTAMGLSFNFKEYATGKLGGRTLRAGVYNWGTSVAIPTVVTISGASNDVWVFQVAGNVIVSTAARVVLKGGAQAKNIFWVVAGMVDMGTNSKFEGIVLSKNNIVLKTGATVNGRLYAQTAVTLDKATVIKPL